ncbi:MAG: hypothetical protein V3T72_13040 [Thermoanaerobaculia bacterium]
MEPSPDLSAELEALDVELARIEGGRAPLLNEKHRSAAESLRSEQPRESDWLRHLMRWLRGPLGGRQVRYRQIVGAESFREPHEDRERLRERIEKNCERQDRRAWWRRRRQDWRRFVAFMNQPVEWPWRRRGKR